MVKPEDRMLGPAGIFNTGTNLLFQLMKENCDIKEARLSKTHTEPKRNGIRWQAPWGKHNPPGTHRLKHVAKMWGESPNGKCSPFIFCDNRYFSATRRYMQMNLSR